jgi:ribosomal protein S18 acetylase RimI-like enzyme
MVRLTNIDEMRACIRPYRTTDESAVVGVWHRAGRTAYTYLPNWQALTLEHAHHVFRQVILPGNVLWVGTLGEHVVAYLALRGSYIDRLYVDPPEQRKGWGSRLVDHAKTLHPDGLELHTHQQNYAARMLYERHGFVAVRFGLSPAPELAPDVEYHWRSQEGA